MSARPHREVVLQRVPIAGERALPSLAALFHKTVDIAGTGKRKIDGECAATRLGGAMTSRWANERFRQVGDASDTPVPDGMAEQIIAYGGRYGVR